MRWFRKLIENIVEDMTNKLAEAIVADMISRRIVDLETMVKFYANCEVNALTKDLKQACSKNSSSNVDDVYEKWVDVPLEQE